MKPVLKQCIECTEVFDWIKTPLNQIILNQLKFGYMHNTDVAAEIPLSAFEFDIRIYLCKECIDKVNEDPHNWKIRLRKISSAFRDLLKECEYCMEFGEECWIIYVCPNHRDDLKEEVKKQYN